MNKRKFLKSFWALPLLIPAIVSAEEKEEQIFKKIVKDDGSIDITILNEKFLNIKDTTIDTTVFDNNMLCTKKTKGKIITIGENSHNVTITYPLK